MIKCVRSTIANLTILRIVFVFLLQCMTVAPAYTQIQEYRSLECELSGEVFSQKKEYADSGQRKVELSGGWESAALLFMGKYFSKTTAFLSGIQLGHDHCKGFDQKSRVDAKYHFCSNLFRLGSINKYRTLHTESLLSFSLGMENSKGYLGGDSDYKREQTTPVFQIQSQFSYHHDRCLFSKIQVSGLIKKQLRQGDLDVSSSDPGTVENARPDEIIYRNATVYSDILTLGDKDFRSGLFTSFSIETSKISEGYETRRVCDIGLMLGSSAIVLGYGFSLDEDLESYYKIYARVDGFQLYRLIKK